MMESNIDDDDTREKNMHLFFGIAKGKTDEVKSLLENGVKTDIIDKNNTENTPLHSAVEKDQKDMVVELLNPKWKTDINIKNAEGNTPLDIAKQSENLEIIELLQSHHEKKICSLEASLLVPNDDKTLLPYKRTKGSGGIEGQLCEIYLSMLLLLKGTIDERIKSFYIASNMLEADKFDDVVFKYDYIDGRSKIVFLQSKHRTNDKVVTLNEVLTNSEKKIDFALNKYFISYRKIKRYFEHEIKTNHPIFSGNFENSEFIIYTNGSFNYGRSDSIKEVPNEIALLVNNSNAKYFQLVYNSDKRDEIFDLVKNSSDCRRLAKELAAACFSQNGLDIQKEIVQNYHQALQKTVFEETVDLNGTLKDSFLNGKENFTRVFFKEAAKFLEKPDNVIIQELQQKKIKLSKKFWDKNCSGYSDLPDDEPITEQDVESFLNKFKLYASQPNEKELEESIKEISTDFYKIDKQDIDSVFAVVKESVQNWWKDQSVYLTKDNKFFEGALRVSFEFNVMEPVTSFSGREQELVKLHKILQKGGDAVISQSALISGLGGIGKSETARKYLSVYKNHYDNNVIWINAENYSTIVNSFHKLAKERLKIRTSNLDGTEKEIKTLMDDVFNFYMRMHRKCIFVFDNAEKHGKGGVGVDELLPVGLNKPYVLITSREQGWGGIQNLLLDVLTDEAAGEFIRKALKDLIDVEENDARRLANALGNFPLALRQAVAFISMQNQKAKKWSREQFTIISYLKLFQENAPKVLSDSPEMNQNRYTQTVMTTWKTTLQKITQMNEPRCILALKILNVIGYLAPDDIPVEDIFPTEEGKLELEYAIELLDQYSMVSLKGGKVSIHRLVQHVTRIELEKQGLNDGIFEEIFVSLEACFPTYSQQRQDFYKKRPMLPHYEAFLSHIEDLLTKQPGKRKKIENGYLVDYFHSMADGYRHYPERQKQLLLRSLEISEQHFGSNHYKVAITLDNLSCAYDSLGDEEKRKQLSDRASDILVNHYGSDYCLVATTMINIGDDLKSLGDPQKQMQLLKHALESRGIYCGPDFVQMAATINHLRLAYSSLGNAKKKMLLMEHALEVQKKHFGPYHFEIATTLHILGMTYGSLGNLQKRQQVLEQALEIQEKHLGPDHYLLAETLHDLGNAYGALGYGQKQKQFLERSLAIQEKHYGYDHYEVALTLHRLGKAYALSNDAQKGTQVLERALKINLNHYGPDHYEVAETLVNLCIACKALGDVEREKQVLERTLPILQKNNYTNFIFRIGPLSFIKNLINCGLDVLERDYHDTVLHKAVANNNDEIINLILDKIFEKDPENFDRHINAKDSEGDTPLMWAAKNRNINAAKVLIERGADVDAQNKNGQTVLDWAIKLKFEDLVQLLLKAKAEMSFGDNNGVPSELL